MKQNIKTRLIISFSLLTLGCLASGVAVSYANYKATELSRQSVGYSGKLDQMSIFFNANIWEVDNALFFLYNNTTGKWVAPTRTINPTIGGTNFTLHVFVLQAPTSTNNIVFARVNPNGRSIPVDGQNTAWDFEDGDGKTIWNQTDNFTFSTSYNYYCIPGGGWKTGTYKHNNNTEENSGCKKNNLTLSGTTLSFDDSDSDVTSTS